MLVVPDGSWTRDQNMLRNPSGPGPPGRLRRTTGRSCSEGCRPTPDRGDGVLLLGSLGERLSSSPDGRSGLRISVPGVVPCGTLCPVVDAGGVDDEVGVGLSISKLLPGRLAAIATTANTIAASDPAMANVTPRRPAFILDNFKARMCPPCECIARQALLSSRFPSRTRVELGLQAWIHSEWPPPSLLALHEVLTSRRSTRICRLG